MKKRKFIFTIQICFCVFSLFCKSVVLKDKIVYPIVIENQAELFAKTFFAFVALVVTGLEFS